MIAWRLLDTARLSARRILGTSLIVIGLCVAGMGTAEAVPSYAVQTGQPCTACHVGGFGPQLTPFGRQFKLEGYTLRGPQDFVAPLSAMAVAAYLHTSADQSPPV